MNRYHEPIVVVLCCAALVNRKEAVASSSLENYEVDLSGALTNAIK